MLNQKEAENSEHEPAAVIIKNVFLILWQLYLSKGNKGKQMKMLLYIHAWSVFRYTWGKSAFFFYFQGLKTNFKFV